MRRGLSRRNLVTGTAWAAPLVLSTAVIPAYASSSADDGPCLDPDKSYDIFAKDVRTAAQSRAAGEKGYEEIVVPDYASYMRFYLRGGSGGSLATRYSEATGYNRTGGTAGGGAYIQGTVKVTPGQRIKFYVGASGVGYYDRPAKGGEGYGNGGSSAAMPTELGSDVQPRSLMVCYRVTVDASQPVTHLDGEIHSARWFTAPELAQAIAEQRTGEPKLELPGTNAVARRMLDEWLQEKGL